MSRTEREVLEILHLLEVCIRDGFWKQYQTLYKVLYVQKFSLKRVFWKYGFLIFLLRVSLSKVPETLMFHLNYRFYSSTKLSALNYALCPKTFKLKQDFFCWIRFVRRVSHFPNQQRLCSSSEVSLNVTLSLKTVTFKTFSNKKFKTQWAFSTYCCLHSFSRRLSAESSGEVVV